MKGKKLLSMLTAGALAVSMVVPAMAADGGEFEVDVTTKTGILRVEVPTTLAIAVDQFETTDVGTQIYSAEFPIKNRSQVDVKINVTSTATVKDSVALAAKRGDVATATAAGGTAWLAVAAKKSATNYEATSGNDNLASLNETAANVTTFAKGSSGVTAAQTFYLAKASDAATADTTATYKMMKTGTAGKSTVAYAQLYKLTKKTFTASSEQTELDALLAAEDVYVLAATTETDGAVLTRTAKNGTAGTLTYSNSNTYYTIATDPTAVKDVTTADVYAYPELTAAGTGADAAFRYIGALSSNKEVWDATDISKVKIAYTIQGLPQSVYTAATTDGLTYGLYKEKLAATYSVTGGKGYLSVDGAAGFAAAPTSLKVGNTALTADTDYTYHDNGWIELKTQPAASSVIELVINGTTYKVTVPTA